ncbi:hypothetical protein AAHC03_022887 [Spirometra sp. Aus1]
MQQVTEGLATEPDCAPDIARPPVPRTGRGDRMDFPLLVVGYSSLGQVLAGVELGLILPVASAVGESVADAAGRSAGAVEPAWSLSLLPLPPPPAALLPARPAAVGPTKGILLAKEVSERKQFSIHRRVAHT